VTDLCSGGELFERILADTYFSERQAARIIQQLLGATAYMHSVGICHRDLKPESCLLESTGAIETCVIKLIDFRTAREFQNDTVFQTRWPGSLHRAPEVFRGLDTHLCDSWSCGAIMYMITAGYPPFPGDTERDIVGQVMTDFYFVLVPRRDRTR
jgi:calcium-dependent protein kinase